MLDEIGNQPDSYLSRVVADNVKGFSDVQTSGVMSALYELSYRKALADIVLAFNDAVDLNLAGILNPQNTKRLPKSTANLKGDEALVQEKPDSPLWELPVCEKVDGKVVDKCEGSGTLRDIFDVLDTIGNRHEETLVPTDVVMGKLNTVFAF
jgi:hypothetical protein